MATFRRTLWYCKVRPRGGGPLTDDYEEAGDITWRIENRVITIINAGAESGENIGLRPLREVTQNSDDARADRICVRLTEDSLSFSNDGQTLARLKDSPESSTLDALMEIDSGHKEADPESSGHFGS